MSFELRAPIKTMAHERCACGRISLPPTQWDTIGVALRKWKKPIPHSPNRLVGCEVTGQHRMEAAPDVTPSPTHPEAERRTTGNGSGVQAPPPQPAVLEPAPPVKAEEPPKGPWYQRKDETGLFLDLPTLHPEYHEWKKKLALALKEYLRKHETFFADDFWKASGLTPHPKVPNAFSGIVRAAEAARWIERTPETRMHYPVREGQPWGGKAFRVWKSLLYPDKEPEPRPLARPHLSLSAQAGRTCSQEGCTRILRVNNLSGLCQAHRQLVPGRQRDKLISDAVRKAAEEGRLVLGKVAAPEETKQTPQVRDLQTGKFHTSGWGGVRPGAGRHYREVDVDKVLALQRQGVSTRKIAKTLGISRDTLYRRLNEAGRQPAADWHAAAGQKGAAARWGKHYSKQKDKEEVKRVEKKEYIANMRLAMNVNRSPVTTMFWGRKLGFTPTLVDGKLGWTAKEAQAITEKVATLRVVNSKRKHLPRYRGPTNGAAVAPPPSRKPQEKGKEAPIGKWLKLQMEEAGVTYCLYEKEKGITIRRQRVVEEEESYE